MTRSSPWSTQVPKSLHAIIVLAEIANQHTDGLVDVQRIDRDHLLEVCPILRPIEECFEDSKVGTAQERDLPATELVDLATLRCLDMKLGGVQEHIHWCL